MAVSTLSSLKKLSFGRLFMDFTWLIFVFFLVIWSEERNFLFLSCRFLSFFSYLCSVNWFFIFAKLFFTYVLYLNVISYMKQFEFDFVRLWSQYISNAFPMARSVADFIACQFALESDFGTSNLAVTKHNIIGMKNPMIRISTARRCGVSSPETFWAEYDSLTSCVVDYFLCLQYHRPDGHAFESVDSFSRFISKFYCPEKDYLNKINRIYQQFKSYKNE